MTVRKTVGRWTPGAIRRWWRACFDRAPQPPPTVAEGWEQYAKEYASTDGAHLGDEWNDPAEIGLDVASAADVVPYLDEHVITPFFASCDVILEIGAGGGRFTAVLLNRCQRLIAADTSPEMVRLLQQRFSNDKRLKCILLDGRGLGDIPDSSVDGAFSYGVFVHLQHWDIYNYLTELKRVLRPGGRALIQHANTFSDLGWRLFLSHVRMSLNRHKLYGTFTVMSPAIIREFVERTGLELEACRTDIARRDCISLIRSPVA